MHELGWGALLLFVVAAVRGRAAEDLSVLAPKTGQGLLKAYLLAECQTHFDARRKAVEALATPEQFFERQKKLRADWLSTIGPFPERTPLNPRVVGSLDGPGYRIEKTIYESRPNHHVTANLYLPAAGKPPFPGILLPCGHSANGKAEKAYQAAAILLATHGFVVLSYDPIGQGERCQTLDDKGKPIVSNTTEHTLVGVGALLTGLTTAGYRIWDGVRSLDYLASRPEVDPQRLGCTGNSGGGTMTTYLMAFDDRVAVAAPSCYITTLERLFATIGPQDAEQNFPGQVALGIEHADFIAMRAPKPTLVCTATKDFFDIAGSWTTFREAKRLYALLGHAERMDLFEFNDGHGFSKPRREAVLRWMRRWLQGIDDAPTEPADLKLHSDAELQVSQSGQIVHDLKGITVWDLNLAQAKALAPQRETFWRDNPKEKCLAEVCRLAGIRSRSRQSAESSRQPERSAASSPPPTPKTDNRKPITPSSVGTIERDGYLIEKLLVERAGEMPVPALLFVPKPRRGRLPGVLYVDGRGKAEDAKPGGAVEKLVLGGRVVLSIDVRGFGETLEKPPKDAYFGTGIENPFLAMHVSRPLLGQRVEDTLAALDLLAERPEADAAKLSVVGIGKGGPIALHAAALDERLSEVTVERSIESWMDVVATPLGKDQLTQVVPGALTRYDLPDLVRAIAPRPVVIRYRIDPTGKLKPAP